MKGHKRNTTGPASAGLPTNNAQWMTREQHQEKTNIQQHSPYIPNIQKSTAHESLNHREHFCVDVPWQTFLSGNLHSFFNPITSQLNNNCGTFPLHLREVCFPVTPTARGGGRCRKTIVVSLAPCLKTSK